MPVRKSEHWKDASEERRSLESDIQDVFLFWDKCISKYMCDYWITGPSGSLVEVTIKRMMHL